MRFRVVLLFLCEYTYLYEKHILYLPPRLTFKSQELRRKANERFSDDPGIKQRDWKARGGTARSSTCITERCSGLQPFACVALPKIEWLIVLRLKARNYLGQAQEVKPTYIHSSHAYDTNSARDRWWINGVTQSCIREQHWERTEGHKTSYLPGVLKFLSKNSYLRTVQLQAVKYMATVLALYRVSINHYERHLKDSVGLLSSPVVTSHLRFV